MKYSLIFFLFIFSSIIKNIKLSYFILMVIIILIGFLSKKSLRFSGGFRFWIFPFLFFILLSFNLNNYQFNLEKLIYNFKIFLHLYVFSVIINFINDNLRIKDIYFLLDRYGFKKAKFSMIFIVFAMKKLKNDITEIFYFYRLNYYGFNFIYRIPILMYVIIRNAIKISYNFIEIIYIRGLYEN